MTLQLDDIQGLVLRGFGAQTHAAFLFLRMREVAAARLALAALAREIEATSSAAAHRGDIRIQLAFTAGGLRRLGLDDSDLSSFPIEFQEGMAWPDRARILGDTDGSAPPHWQFGGAGDGGIDVWLGLYARGAEPLRVLIEDWRAELGAFDVIADQRSIPRVDDREHFGFRDGISQPAIEGDPVPPQVGQEVVRAGEFVLGYPNQYGKLPLSPSVPSGGDRGQLELSPDGRLDLGRNGTFLVFRKLEQDVEAFWSFFRAAARAEDGSERPEVATYLAAKSVGRWPSGAPLVLSPERDDPALGADPARNNDFRFASADPHGLLCPVSSHIRRANPRDAKGPLPEESLEVTARHRIIRRGRMYQEAGGARGVLFVCVNANLRRQFEFLQQSWVCNPKFEGLRDERDPTTGNSDGGPASCFRIPARTYRRRLTNLPRFVHVRGGAYLFMPGIAALHWLAGAGAGYNANGRSGG